MSGDASPKASGSARPWRSLIAAGGVVVAMPFAAWAWIGDQSESGDDLDYLWQPPNLTSSQERWIFVASTVVLAGSLVALWVAHRRGSLSPRLLLQTMVLAGFAVLVGGGYRVITAGVIGANIGGGLILLGAIPTAGATVALFFVVSRTGSVARTTPGPPPPGEISS